MIADISEVLLEMGLASGETEEERAIANSSLIRAAGAVRRFLQYDPIQLERTEFYPPEDILSRGESVWEVNDNQAYLRHRAGRAGAVLCMRHIPIRSITSLFIDYDGRAGTRSGAFGASTEKTEGDEFWPNYDGVDSSGNSFCSDGIIRNQGSWPTVPGSVKVIYVAGYTQEEFHGQDPNIDASPILETVISEAVRRMKRFFGWKKQTAAGHVAGPITSESLGDYSYSVDAAAMERILGGKWDLLGESKERLTEFINYGYQLGG